MLTLETGLVLAVVGTAIAIIHRLRPTASPPWSPSLEPRVRAALGKVLGIDTRGVSLDASLARDLGCSPDDVIAAAAALEADLGIIIPERTLRGVRTARDLVRVTRALADEREDDAPPFVRAHLVSTGDSPEDVRYTGWLTAEAARSLAEQAFRAGPGAHLQVEVIEDTDLELGWVAAQFAWLRELGIRVGIGLQTPPAGSASAA
jgi:acyl carrier protein